MTAQFDKVLASRDVASLYYILGEALCMIQLLEDALSHSITLKKDVRVPYSMPKAAAAVFLQKNRSLTFGQALKMAKKYKLCSDILLDRLAVFLAERNWLVHKCLIENIDNMHEALKREQVFYKIKTIFNTANILQRAVEEDLMHFSELRGLDMSGVRTAIERYYRL